MNNEVELILLNPKLDPDLAEVYNGYEILIKMSQTKQKCVDDFRK